MKKSKPVRTSQKSVSLGITCEREWREQGYTCIAGVDEVGRGPLAGPVVAAAVVLDFNNVPGGLCDSKAISAIKREKVFEDIMSSSRVGVASVPATVIDRINIRQASLLAMRNACLALDGLPDLVLVDGRDTPEVPCKAVAIIKGDAKIASIAAASIVAKVIRDQTMKKLANFFPQFLFEKNAGYGVSAHRAALDEYGPTICHRLSFSPISQGRLKV